MKRLWILFPILLILATVAGAMVREARLQPDGKTHIAFLDIGQGDSALITTARGRHIVIDGGPDLSTLEYLGSRMPFFDRTIDLLVLSHPNSDHLASFPEILRRYHVAAVLLAGSQYPLARYEWMLSEIRTQRIPVILANTHRTIDVSDGVRLEILWPPSAAAVQAAKDVNDVSDVIRLSYGNHSALFTGDIGVAAEKAIVAAQEDLHADILKIAHHGSKYSTSSGFLLAVHPQLAIISVGKDNTYGHPTPTILRRLEYFGILYKRTDRDGTVEVVWQ